MLLFCETWLVCEGEEDAQNQTADMRHLQVMEQAEAEVKKLSNQSKKWVTQLCICPDRLNTKETGSLSYLLPIPFCTLVLSPILSNASNPCLNWLSLWHDYGRVQKVHRLVF